MKVCCKCKLSKPESAFYKKRTTKDGLERYCKECHKIMNRSHYQRNMSLYKTRALKFREELTEWISSLKSSLGCKRCGETKSWRLSFHHRDPSTKIGDVSRMVYDTCSRRLVLEEIEKCDVLCHNCHSDVHHS